MVAILTTHKEANTGKLPTQPLHKQLKISILKAPRFQLVRIICQSNKTIILMHTGLMNTSHSPITTTLQTTANTLTARQLQSARITRLIKNYAPIATLIGVNRMKTRQRSEPNTTAHNRILHINSLNARNITLKLTSRRTLIDAITLNGTHERYLLWACHIVTQAL